MSSDYRNTVYCPAYVDVGKKKHELVKKIKEEHSRAVDMHAIISPNKSNYKDDFMGIYNHKCSYCGVSSAIISRSEFEIDHFVFEKSDQFKSKKDAGHIENLVLACHLCNHNKSSFEFPEAKYNDLYPDTEQIKKTFTRDEEYYIKVSDDKIEDETINAFYKKLDLGAEIHRIDYLLMNMMGLQEKINNKPQISAQLGLAIKRLHTKRNSMVTKS